MSKFKLDVMLSDIEPILQVCFEADEWHEPSAKLETVRAIASTLADLGFYAPCFGVVQNLKEGKPFNEIKFFEQIETLLNINGFYTYNSDSWFEVYEPEQVTSEVLAQIEE